MSWKPIRDLLSWVCAVLPSWSDCGTFQRRVLEITGDYWKLLEITGDYWKLLEITGDYWKWKLLRTIVVDLGSGVCISVTDCEAWQIIAFWILFSAVKKCCRCTSESTRAVSQQLAHSGITPTYLFPVSTCRQPDISGWDKGCLYNLNLNEHPKPMISIITGQLPPIHPV